MKYKKFMEAMGDRDLKDEFYAAIEKEPKDFTDVDLRALIKRMGYLTDDERFKFRNLLVFENLTEDEKTRYHSIYPERTGGGKFGMYFPKKDDVEAHYKTHFVGGRT